MHKWCVDVCGGCGRLKILAPWIWQSISTNGYNQRLKTQYTCQWLKSGTLDLVACSYVSSWAFAKRLFLESQLRCRGLATTTRLSKHLKTELPLGTLCLSHLYFSFLSSSSFFNRCFVMFASCCCYLYFGCGCFCGSLPWMQFHDLDSSWQKPQAPFGDSKKCCAPWGLHQGFCGVMSRFWWIQVIIGASVRSTLMLL